ncbi:hypothetical protein [Klebsiella variicola]|uniref:hypothetical protein n=1 Tax=Klebsiella variicola TaxID=244366 RepID=UPI0015E9FCF5|nr:hypothetical protein [Klebsiella variicola]QLS62956.1 hypothetical protein HV312_26845 [Klebsiella variicola]HBY2240616.1 hypothetical protein [Klebsiella pneumoniae]HCB0486910.1 hypothetical protein [Klebsiella pneumoniae]
MHVVLMVLGGFLLQAFFLLTGILWGSFPQAVLSACRLFIPVWVAVALINLYVGVFRAGYSLREEIPVLFIIIAIPAGAAALLLWRVSR